ncbi:HDL281Wp [Eremothecium sinecaudum]|uniref:Serine/threonine-protein kinase Tel1 n=1 Tax=Eremothecium sinecaudum TaxID=45286 RepID=A0A120K255_9SACH|nr:HDL281Wp [Eremothecium sinecaudum]AMD20463.1 HDL281Wp [Eremothecium sinecaudum]
MESNVRAILDLLSSTKVKERSQAFDELTAIIKENPTSLSNKAISEVIHVLIGSLHNERTKYEQLCSKHHEQSSKLSAVETRLNAVACLLRLLIENTCHRVKRKQIKTILDEIPILLVHTGTKKLIQPVSQPLTAVLRLVCESDPFVLKFEVDQWKLLTRNISGYIIQHLDLLPNDKAITNLTEALVALIQIDTIGFKDMCAETVKVPLKYFDVVDKETTKTRYMLQLCNLLIQKGHLVQFRAVSYLIERVIKHLLAFTFPSGDSIHEEISVFTIFASELIYHNVPLKVGDLETRRITDDSSRKQLFQQFLRHQLDSYRSNKLSLKDIEYRDLEDKILWYQLDDFQLSASGTRLEWLHLFGTSKFLISYYRLLANSSPSRSDMREIKRRKIADSFENILLDSSNIAAFVTNCISSDNGHIQLTGLQLAAVVTALHDFPYHELLELKETIINNFSKISIIGWCCLAMIPMLSQKDVSFSIDEVLTLIKLALPLIKSVDTCSVGCILLARLLKYEDRKFTNKALLQQIHDVYELSTLIGPNVMSNESYLFWQYIYYYGISFKGRTGNSGVDCIISWIVSKWDQLSPANSSQDSFPEFISWLAGCPPSEYSLRPKQFPSVSKYYFEWNYFACERQYLLNVLPLAKVGRSSSRSIPLAKVTDGQLSDVFYKIQHQIENSSDVGDKYGWICFAVLIIENIKGSSHLAEHLKDFKSTIAVAVSSLDIQNMKDLSCVINMTYEFTTCPAIKFALNNFDIYKLLNLYTELQPQEFLVGSINDDFLNSKKANRMVYPSNHLHGFNDTFQICQVVKFIITVIDPHADGAYFNEVIDFYEMVMRRSSIDTVFQSSLTLISYLKIVNRSNIQSAKLISLTEFIGSTFLNADFNTSTISMTYLALYLESISDIWTDKNKESSLNADCNDILDWLYSRLQDVSFSGCEAILAITNLTLQLLKGNHSKGVLNCGKQDLFHILTTCLGKIPLFYLGKVVEKLKTYIIKLGLRNQNIIFTEIMGLFDTPQENGETAAFYSLVLANLGSISHMHLSNAITHLLPHLVYDVVNHYADSFMEIVIRAHKLNNSQELFHVCRFDILNNWCINSAGQNGFMTNIWNFGLFKFKDMEYFVSLYRDELMAFYFSKISPYNYLRTLLGFSDGKVPPLLERSLRYAIPLAYMEGGIGDSIFDICADQWSQSKTINIIRSQNILIFDELLQFCDTCEFENVLKSLKKVFPNSRALYKMENYYPKLRPRFQPHCSITSILRVAKTRLSMDNYSKHELRFLLTKNLLNLQNSTILDDTCHILRKITIILVLFESELSHCPHVNEVLTVITDYLDAECFSDEIFLIIGSFIDYSPEIESIEHILVAVFAKLLSQPNIREGLGYSNFMDDIKTILSVYSEKMMYSKWWSICIEILTNSGGNINLDLYLDDSLLDTKDFKIRNIKLFSEILSFLPDFRCFPNDFKTKETVVKNLIKNASIDNSLSANFLLWKGHYIGCCQQNDYISLGRYSSDSATEICTATYIKCYGTIDNIFTVIMNLQSSGNPMQKYVTECILSTFLYNKDSLVNFLTDPSPIYKNLSSEFLPLTPFAFSLLFDIPIPKHNLNSLTIMVFSSAVHSYVSWISEICVLLLNLLDIYLPGLKIVGVLIEQIPTSAEQLITHLVLLIMYCDPKVGTELLSHFLLNINLLNNKLDSELKIKCILRLFLLVRSFHRMGYKEFQNIYSTLNLCDIYKIATTVGEYKTAVLIFEEFHISSSNQLDLDTMKQIYTQLNDIDFIYGIPTMVSLSSAINLMHQTSAPAWRVFAFNNAIFDLEYKKGNISNENLTELIHSASSNGFNGLAYALQGNASTDVSKDAYSWCINLNKWDLQLPAGHDCREKSVYSVLKQVAQNRTSLQETFNKSILDIVGKTTSSGNIDDYIKSLSDVITLHRIYTNNEDDLIGLIHARDRRMLQQAEFSDCSLDIKMRQVFLVQLISKYDKALIDRRQVYLQFQNICELAHLSELARKASDFQESLTAVLALENHVESLPEFSDFRNYDLLKTLAKRLSRLQAAKVLWFQNENSISTLMLKDLLQVPINSASLSRIPFRQLRVSDLDIKAQLVEWMSCSRQEVPERILDAYITDSNDELKKLEDRGKQCSIVHMFGEFCCTQAKQYSSSDEMQILAKRLNKNKDGLSSLSQIYHNKKLPERERKEAKRHYARLITRDEQESETYERLKAQKELFVTNALHFYAQTLQLGDEYDGEVVDKFCGLWFEYANDNSVNEKIASDISLIPSYKLLPWINQMASKLANEKLLFQDTLQTTMARILYKLPYESLYALIGVTLETGHDSSRDPVTASRISAAERVLTLAGKLDEGKFYSDYIHPIKEFCQMSLKLAHHEFAKNTRMLHLENLKAGSYWLHTLILRKLPLPTVQVNISSSLDGRKSRPYITKVESRVNISSSGLSMPKIVSLIMSDGKKYKILLKAGDDDLRQDAIMEQVFKQVNKLLLSNRNTRKCKLRVRTYEVIPLGPRAGIIEFAQNSRSLHEVLTELHKYDKLSFDQARKAMKAVQGKTKHERLSVYLKITESIKPKLSNFFFNNFLNPEEWLIAKTTYTKGVVTTSIVGYILGLGDRHLNNILLDKFTGEPIHIDLGVAFDQGKLLPIPELVPFRLTRDIIDGFGVTGVEGVFRKNCERVYGVLRQEHERMMSVLNILKWDPLYSWRMTPLRKRRLQNYASGEDSAANSLALNFSYDNENDESIRALKGVHDKLKGNNLSVEATVRELIQHATDVNNLAIIFMGWSPFY